MADILAKELIYQTLNDRHGIVNQEKLNNAKVAIAGLGGLGSNIAVALARIGVSHLHLIDFDKVDISNLNRQHYFISHLNKYKTQALAEQLQMINPYLNIVTDCIKVTEDNIFSLFKDEDIRKDCGIEKDEVKNILSAVTRTGFCKEKVGAYLGYEGDVYYTTSLFESFLKCIGVCAEETENS